MDWNLYIITPLGGAVIGYFTNWLAIKMLFRPHEAKKIFGISIPFTPGLIPKERFRLSAKIGQALGEHVLTNDVILQTILNTDGVVDKFLEEYIEKLQNSPLTPKDITGKLSDIVAAEELGALSDNIKDMLIKALKSPAAVDKISSLAFELVIQLLKSENAATLAVNLLKKLKPQLFERAQEYLQNGALEEYIEKNADNFYEKLKADERALNMIIPEKIVEIVKAAITNKLPDLADFIKNLPFGNPAINNVLKDLTYKVIDDNLGTIASIFINKEKMYSNLRFGLYEFLSNDDNLKSISGKASEIIDNFLSESAAHYLAMLPPDGEKQLKANFFTMISDNISYEFIEKTLLHIYDYAIDLIESSGIRFAESSSGRHMAKSSGTIYDILTRFMPEFENSLQEYIKSRTSGLIDTYADTIVDGAFSAIIAYISELRIDSFIKGIKPDNLDAFKVRLLKIIRGLIERGAKKLFEEVSIAKMTEEQINKFEVTTAEEIILSVVNKELKAITNLGGILGLIIGFFPVITNMLGGS